MVRSMWNLSVSYLLDKQTHVACGRLRWSFSQRATRRPDLAIQVLETGIWLHSQIRPQAYLVSEVVFSNKLKNPSPVLAGAMHVG